MKDLTTALLGKACRVFLTLAYPEGEHLIPHGRTAYLELPTSQPVERFLTPPLCQTLLDNAGRIRGYALRLGSSRFPHLKLQAVVCDRDGTVVFAVDTHDSFVLANNHPDALGWMEIQVSNREIKERIERAWEAEGLLTFNELLRRGLREPGELESRFGMDPVRV